MRVWLLTNGYGEDRAGAAIAREVLAQRPGLQLAAASLVTPGDAFSPVHVTLSGTAPRSGGFPAAGVRTILGDLPAVPGYFRFVRRLRQVAAPDDLFVAVGDVFLTGLARLAFRAPGVHVALAKSVHGRRHSRVERALLRQWTRLVFTRDAATATHLQSCGVRAAFAGNPLLDGLRAAACQDCQHPEHGSGPFSARVLLLPGSRVEAPGNLVKLLGVALAVKRTVEWTCAWSPAVAIELGTKAALAAGWNNVSDRFIRDECVVTLTDVDFEARLRAADVVVGLAGTANEQAAALGKPVVTFVGCGPQTTAARMREQERLLGGAAEFVQGGTAAVASAVTRLVDRPEERDHRGALGVARLGPPGGARRIAEGILAEFRL